MIFIYNNLFDGFLRCGSITLGKFFCLTNLLIDFNHDLYESIGIHEVSTLNLKNIYGERNGDRV
jgi:hypothetical protein